MRYKASMYLNRADTTGRVPSSILDEFVRDELLRQIGRALKPHLTIHQLAIADGTSLTAHADQVDFSTELVVIPGDAWQRFGEQLGQLCHALSADETHELRALLDAVGS